MKSASKDCNFAALFGPAAAILQAARALAATKNPLVLLLNDGPEMERALALAGPHYEAYEPMATRQLEKIFDQLHAAHPCTAVHFIHRLGWVPVGEAPLFVRVLAAHRREALRFLAEAIDRMKTEVPIWKRA